MSNNAIVQEDALKAPFPYFGGKSSIAAEVWAALGQPKHYIEPFFGSGAVLLMRPSYIPGEHVETVNDSDGFVCNVWRALKSDPDEVAKWCDWPVNHADLSARKKRLIENESRLLENLIADDTWCDPKLAGYWIWAASCWIGGGLTRVGQIPHLSDAGKGVHKIGSRPHLSHAGVGVHKIGQRPHLCNAGKGVHKIGSRPHIAKQSPGVHKLSMRGDGAIYDWFHRLSERLRHVRVVCGDWTRVCGGDWQDRMGPVGIFFDPPYGVTDRDTDVYHHDSTDVAAAVRDWCLKRGDRPSHRIVLAGYDEHEALLEHSWTVKRWSAHGGYANLKRNDGEAQGKENRHREALYFSPHCVNTRQEVLGV